MWFTLFATNQYNITHIHKTILIYSNIFMHAIRTYISTYWGCAGSTFLFCEPICWIDFCFWQKCSEILVSVILVYKMQKVKFTEMELWKTKKAIYLNVNNWAWGCSSVIKYSADILGACVQLLAQPQQN